MSRVRLVLLGLLAVFAVGAVASASASAACTKEANKKFILCLGEPLVLTEGTLALHIKTDPGATYELSTEAGIKLLSKAIDEATGSLTSLVAPATNNVTIQGIALHFTSVLVDLEPCKVAGELVKTELLFGTVEGKEKVLFQPATSEIFTTIKIEGCPEAGNFNVKLNKGKGGVLCESPVEVTRLEQLFKCESHELLFGEEAATFKGSFLVTVLSGGAAAKWAVIEGK